MKVIFKPGNKPKTYEVMDIKSNIHEYYRLIGCRCFDMVPVEQVGKTCIYAVCDDEYLLKNDVLRSQNRFFNEDGGNLEEIYPFQRFENNDEAWLFGNLVFIAVDVHGEDKSLTEEQIEYLKNRIEE